MKPFNKLFHFQKLTFFLPSIILTLIALLVVNGIVFAAPRLYPSAGWVPWGLSTYGYGTWGGGDGIGDGTSVNVDFAGTEFDFQGGVGCNSGTRHFNYYVDGAYKGDAVHNDGGTTYITGLSPAFHTFTASADGSTCHIQNIRAVGQYDVTAPSNPTFSNESHGIVSGVATTNTTPNISWNSSVDPETGIAYYNIYWGPSSAGSTATTTTTSLTYNPTISSDGTYYLFVQAVNGAGLTSNWVNVFTYIRDTTAPSTVNGLTDQAGTTDNLWEKSINQLHFTWNASTDGGSSVAGYNAYFGPASNGAGTFQTGTTYTPAVLTTSGIYYFRVNSQDNAGNQSSYTTYTVKYDNTLPSASLGVSGTTGANGWYISNVTLTPSGVDTDSGLAGSPQVQVDSGSWASSATISTSGTHTVNYKSIDNAGNINNQSTTINVDLDNPSASPTISSGTLGANGWYITAPTISLNATDVSSGVVLQEYTLDNGSHWTSTTGSITLPEGTNSLKYRITDNAGRVFTSATALIYKVDTSNPSANPVIDGGTLGANGWYKSQVIINPQSADAISGVYLVEAQADLGGWTTFTGDYSLPEGSHSIAFRVTDNAGLQSTTTSTIYQQDSRAPDGYKNPRYAIVSNQIVVTVDLGDDVAGGSGSRGAACSLTSGSIPTSDTTAQTCSKTYILTSGVKTLYVKTLDNAGNWSNESTLNLDTQIIPTVIISSTSPNPSDLDQEYAINVIVSGTGATPTGTVLVSDGSQSCNITLSAGNGSCNLTSITAGTKTITAQYSGDSQYITGSGSLTHTVNKATPTVTINSETPDPSNLDQTYTVSATIGGLTTTPSGKVTISDGSQACNITLSNGSGSCSLASITAGSKTLTASYLGDSSYLTNSATTTHTVNKITPTINITSHDPNPSMVGQLYTIAASVVGGTTIPTGAITVSDGTQSCNISLSAGSGSCDITSQRIGSKTLSLTYGGDNNYLTTISSTTHDVSKGTTSVSITSITPLTSNLDETYTVNVTVEGGGETPTGSVIISEGSSTCNITLSSGVGYCDIKSISAGSRTITASYPGDSNYNASSKSSSHTVNKATPTVSITSVSPAPSVINRPFFVNVSVTGLTTTPSGIVSITFGSFTCNASLSAGSGTCSMTPTLSGSGTLNAVYGGDSNYSSVSTNQSHQVTDLPSDISLSQLTVATTQTNFGTFTTTNGQNPFVYTLTNTGLDCTFVNGQSNDKFSITGTTLKLNAGTAVGNYRICVQVSDTNNDITQKAFTIIVTDPPGVISLSRSSTSIAQLAIGTLSIVGGQSPYTYILATAGAICNGTNGADNGLFDVSGTTLMRKNSSPKGTYQVCVQNTDANGLTAQRAFSIVVVYPPTEIDISSLLVTTSDYQVGKLTTIGGLEPFTYDLETGIGCVGTDNSFFEVYNDTLRRKTTTGAGTYAVCVGVVDPNLDTLRQPFTVTVTQAQNPPPPVSDLSLSSNVLINGDSHVVVGTVVSSVNNSTFTLDDPTSYPDDSLFSINGNQLTFTGMARTSQTFEILIRETTPDNEIKLREVTITVNQNGGDVPVLEVPVKNAQMIEVDTTKDASLPDGATSWELPEIVQMPLHGTATVGSIIYKPDPDFYGRDLVKYRICSNNHVCTTSSVTFDVAAPDGGGELPKTGFKPGEYTDIGIKPDSIHYSDQDLALNIPSLNLKLPIVGVPMKDGKYDITWLGSNVGWLNTTAYPGLLGNSVLTGHVYDSNGQPGPFINLEKLRGGDDVILQSGNSKLIFQVKAIQEITPDDSRDVFIHEKLPTLTLLTCKDYDKKNDNYLKRVMVRAELVGQ